MKKCNKKKCCFDPLGGIGGTAGRAPPGPEEDRRSTGGHAPRATGSAVTGLVSLTTKPLCQGRNRKNTKLLNRLRQGRNRNKKSRLTVPLHIVRARSEAVCLLKAHVRWAGPLRNRRGKRKNPKGIIVISFFCGQFLGKYGVHVFSRCHGQGHKKKKFSWQCVFFCGQFLGKYGVRVFS